MNYYYSALVEAKDYDEKEPMRFLVTTVANYEEACKRVVEYVGDNNLEYLIIRLLDMAVLHLETDTYERLLEGTDIL